MGIQTLLSDQKRDLSIAPALRTLKKMKVEGGTRIDKKNLSHLTFTDTTMKHKPGSLLRSNRGK